MEHDGRVLRHGARRARAAGFREVGERGGHRRHARRVDEGEEDRVRARDLVWEERRVPVVV